MSTEDFEETVIANPKSRQGTEEGALGAFDTLVGQIVLEKWKILERLGEGGLTVVYKAQNLSTKRIVAIKAIRQDLVSNARLVQRFQQEAQATAVLKHPNVMSVQDCFVTRDGRAFLVMDLVEGESLSDLLARSRRLSPLDAARIFLQTAEAIEYAHSKGVLHRDLRPSNIMIEKRAQGSQTDQVRIVDFGFAKLFSQEDSEEVHARADSPYMSPEELEGKPLDSRSDIFALGCVMYESLTGNPPFKGHPTSAQERQAPVIFSGVLGAQAVKDDALLKRLETITMKALEKRPQDRFKTMKEMGSQIEKAITASGGMSRGAINEIKRGQAQKGTGQFEWSKLSLGIAACLGVILSSTFLLAWGWIKTETYTVELGEISEAISRNPSPIKEALLKPTKTVMENVDVAEAYMLEAQNQLGQKASKMQELRNAQMNGASPERQVEIYSGVDSCNEQAKKAYKEAARYFSAAHKLLLTQPNDQLSGKIALRAAEAYWKSEDTDSAKKCFKDAASIFKNYKELVAKSYFYIGHIEFLQKHWETANEAFDAALKSAQQPALKAKIKKDYYASLWNTDPFKSVLIRASMLPDLGSQ